MPTRATILLLAMIGCADAVANEPRWRLSVGAAAEKFAYQEFNAANQRLNREEGTLPGIAGSIAFEINRWLIQGEVKYLQGDVDYAGQAQGGGAVDTHTEQKIVDASLSAGRRFAATNDRLALYGGAGYRKWERDIRSTAQVAGLFETYSWAYWLAGAKLAIVREPRVEFDLDVRITKPFDAKVDIDFNGLFDNVELDLPVNNAWRIAAPIRYRFSRANAIEITPFIEWWDSDRSASKTTRRHSDGALATVTEPRSEHESYGVSVSYVLRF